MNPQHPKAIAAQQRAEYNQILKERNKKRIAQAMAAGLRFLHFGVYTVCYYEQYHGGTIQFSTAIRHPKDKHNKLTGRLVALQHYETSQRVRVVNLYRLDPRVLLEKMLNEIDTY